MKHDIKSEQLSDGNYKIVCVRCKESRISKKPNWIGLCRGKKKLGDYVATLANPIARLFGLQRCRVCAKRKTWLNRIFK